MKKMLTSILVLSTGIAFAKNIDFDTVIKWNSEVISTALTKAGFITSNNAAWDVRKTHERILDELVKKQSFSLRQATQVCLDKCNMSDFLKNGRGQSGKKCPDLCEDFTNALVTVNNEFTKKQTTFELSSNMDYNKPVYKKITVFKKVQVGRPEPALALIKEYISIHDLARATICEKEPKCKSLGQDHIYCDLDGNRYSFEFDDLCDNTFEIVKKYDLPHTEHNALLDAPWSRHALVVNTTSMNLSDEEIEKLLETPPQ